MSIRKSSFTVEVLFETDTMNAKDHEKMERYAYRNMLGANQDMPDFFAISIVRDSSGRLVEFSGSGRGDPSKELLAELSKLTLESRNQK